MIMLGACWAWNPPKVGFVAQSSNEQALSHG